MDRYRGNSPADQQCLDLVNTQTLNFSSTLTLYIVCEHTLCVCVCVQLLDSAWSDLQKSTEAQKEEAPGGHALSDIMHLRHPTVLLRLFIMSYLR